MESRPARAEAVADRRPDRPCERRAEVGWQPTQGLQRRRPGDPVRHEVVPTLEALRRCTRHGAGDPVEAFVVEAALEERHLQRRYPRRGAAGLRGEDRRECERQHEYGTTHGQDPFFIPASTPL